MTVLFILFWILVALIIVELMLYLIISKLRSVFPWLIMNADKVPEINWDLVTKHSRKSFDKELGWVCKPNERGTDWTLEGEIDYRIDDRGCRSHHELSFDTDKIAVFGDSFSFCRLVEDTKTWPYFQSKNLSVGVMNYGVGNYGFDQAPLRMERVIDQLDTTVVIIGIVPETMSRIHSY